jgi:hypothetical protein
VSPAEREETLLPPEEEAAVLALLAAAWRPSELDPRVNQRLIEMALEDPFAEPSPEELVESARLRDALERGTPNEDASLLRALAAGTGAGTGRENDDTASDRALQAALGDPPQPASRPRPNVVYALFGGGSALLAAAAAVTLLIGSTRNGAPGASVTVGVAPSAYVVPHSTASLFSERFETGDTTARMDRIANERRRDLRDNRYAAWGVR